MLEEDSSSNRWNCSRAFPKETEDGPLLLRWISNMSWWIVTLSRIQPMGVTSLWLVKRVSTCSNGRPGKKMQQRWVQTSTDPVPKQQNQICTFTRFFYEKTNQRGSVSNFVPTKAITTDICVSMDSYNYISKVHRIVGLSWNKLGKSCHSRAISASMKMKEIVE